MNPSLLRFRDWGFSLVTHTNEGQGSWVSWEVGCGEVGYKSVLILSEMVYVKQMHEDSFSLVRASVLRMDGGRETAVSSLLWVGYPPPPTRTEEKKIAFYWCRHKED